MAMRFVLLLAVLLIGCDDANASDIEWSVVNPFRFFKQEKSFQVHKEVFNAIVPKGSPVPPDVVLTIERRLNTPSCADPSDFDVCAENPLPGAPKDDRLGWANRNIGISRNDDPKVSSRDELSRVLEFENTKYENKDCFGWRSGAYGYFPQCRREYGDGSKARTEDYIAPNSHAVRIHLSEERLAHLKSQFCTWTFTPVIQDPQKQRPQEKECNQEVVFYRVPYPEGGDGGTVTVVDEHNAMIAQDEIIVRDVLVLGLGDSYASGEGNPDVPVRFAGSPANASFGAWGLPVRYTEPQIYGADPGSNGLSERQREDKSYAARAKWMSPDCHRSQYSYQFRVALELALEDPHRAVTLVHLACSGADTWQGVFADQSSRERGLHEPNTVTAQLKQAEDLLCAGTGATAPPYKIQTPEKWGEPKLAEKKKEYPKCILKRKIDLVLLSLGGNDVGFSGLVGYAIMKDEGVAAPIAKLATALTGHRFIFAPVPRYLNFMQDNLGETKRALFELFGVEPNRVVQTDYEPIAVDEDNNPCSKEACRKGAKEAEKPGDTLGMEVVDGFKFDACRVPEVLKFSARFIKSLQCITAPGPGCKEADFTKATRFHYVDTQAPFRGRGICAANEIERRQFVVPHTRNGADFEPYQPQNYFPYAHRTRLFVAPDDSFMTANTQMGFPGCTPGDLCPGPNDRLQLISRALYGGAFHRTAEAHAIVADTVMPVARSILAAP